MDEDIVPLEARTVAVSHRRLPASTSEPLEDSTSSVEQVPASSRSLPDEACAFTLPALSPSTWMSLPDEASTEKSTPLAPFTVISAPEDPVTARNTGVTTWTV